MYAVMPNLDPWINQQSGINEEESTTLSKFENHLLSIKDERQKVLVLFATQHIMNVNKTL